MQRNIEKENNKTNKFINMKFIYLNLQKKK